MKLTNAEWALVLDGLQQLERDHRDSRNDAEARFADKEYPYRPEAMQASNFHAEQLNKLSLLIGKVWRAKNSDDADTMSHAMGWRRP